MLLVKQRANSELHPCTEQMRWSSSLGSLRHTVALATLLRKAFILPGCAERGSDACAEQKSTESVRCCSKPTWRHRYSASLTSLSILDLVHIIPQLELQAPDTCKHMGESQSLPLPPRRSTNGHIKTVLPANLNHSCPSLSRQPRSKQARVCKSSVQRY